MSSIASRHSRSYLVIEPASTVSAHAWRVLAVASLGGIWCSCSPDFGAAGVLDRFSQIEPKFLLAADGYLLGVRHDTGAVSKVGRVSPPS